MRIKFLTFCREIFEEVDRTPSYRSPGTFRGRTLFRKNSIFFYHPSTLSKNFFGLVSKSFRRVCHNCTLHVSWNLWRKKKFLLYFFLIFFGHWTKTFDLFSRCFVRGWQNCILHVHRNNLRKQTFSVKFLIFSIFLGQRAKTLRLFVEKLPWGSSHLHPTCPQEHLVEEWFFVRLSVFANVFGHWAKIFRPYDKKFSSGFSQLHPTCSWESLEEECVFWNFYCFLSFSDIERNFSTFCRKVFDWFVTTASYMSLGILQEEWLLN